MTHQAMDRAHRIGQGRPVNVYRLVTQGTVEEQVLALQRRKQEMAAAVVQPGNAGRFEERGMAGCMGARRRGWSGVNGNCMTLY